VIDYCSWLKADERIYNEIKAASELSFQFKEKSANYSYVTDLSSTIHRIPLPEVISYRAHFA
jgi:secreted Zn-dependent insulinase-like peptidase